MIREKEWNILQKSQRLFLQWVTDGAIKCEYSVLDFHRQTQVRYKDSYKAVMDFIRSRAAD